MSVVLANILADSASRLWDVLKDRYAEPDLIRWLNYTLDECQDLLHFEKKYATVLGSTYVAALGTTPRYFELPTDFIGLDRNWGVEVNGLRRLPTTDRNIGLYQEKGIASVGEDSTSTLVIDDYFSESYTGIIFHCAIDFVIKNEITATRSGKLLWFTPDLVDADSIKYQYYPLPDLYATGSANAANLIRTTSEVLVLGVVYRGLQKASNGGAISLEKLMDAENRYYKFIDRATDSYNDSKKSGDDMPKIKTAAQVYGMYNSRRG